jgi:hypothetical protein
MMTTEAAEVAAATAAADGRPAATYSAACWLLRLREACMHQPTLYHEVVQALHLRRSRQLSTEDATARVTKLKSRTFPQNFPLPPFPPSTMCCMLEPSQRHLATFTP